ncbi:MAG: hypothetical protein ACYTEP_01865 [Planctomycetota bacterium]|jgi:hypothetical protein
MPHADTIAMVAEPVGVGEGSRRLELIAGTQALLAQAADRWRNEWLQVPEWSANGNRIQAFLRRPHHAFDFAVALQLEAWPARMRVTITTSRDMDAVRKSAAKRRLLFAIRLPGLDANTTALIEASARLHADILQDWKPSRAAAAKTMRTAATQSQAAERLGIRQQSVSEAMRAAHAKHLVAFEETVRGCLSTCTG